MDALSVKKIILFPMKSQILKVFWQILFRRPKLDLLILLLIRLQSKSFLPTGKESLILHMEH